MFGTKDSIQKSKKERFTKWTNSQLNIVFAECFYFLLETKHSVIIHSAHRPQFHEFQCVAK